MPGRRIHRALAQLAISSALTMPLVAQAPPARAPAGAGLAEAQRALSAGDLERAIALGSTYLKRYPASRSAQLLLVQAFVEKDDLQKAYESASRLARSHPRDVDALYYLGLVTRRLAAAELERLMATAPDSARAHQLRAEAFEAQDRRADAEKAYAAALEARADLLDALLGLARLKRIRLACDEAVALYDKAEAIRPTFEGAYGLGVCHSTLQNDELAVTRFQDALARNPDAAIAWAGLGTSLVKLRRTAEGIEKLEKAVALEPAMAEAHYMLGLAYQTAGDGARSAAAFKKAEDLRPR